MPSLKKPSKDKDKDKTGAGGRKKLGTILVDLGFFDDAQLWELLDEAKSTGSRIGEAAVNRGLISAEQLLQALAEQYGMKPRQPVGNQADAGCVAARPRNDVQRLQGAAALVQ